MSWIQALILRGGGLYWNKLCNYHDVINVSVTDTVYSNPIPKRWAKSAFGIDSRAIIL